MKPSKHSKASIKAHPAPDRDKYEHAKDGSSPEYAEACRLVSEARVAFDKHAQSPSQRLDQIGIEAICDEVAEGKSLRAWAIENGFVQQTVINWIDADKDRAGHYAYARDNRADAKFELLEDIGDQAVRAETAVEVAGLRLKSDNIKWMLARMNSKKYGDKTTLAGDSDNPLVVMTASERDARIAELLAKKSA